MISKNIFRRLFSTTPSTSTSPPTALTPHQFKKNLLTFEKLKEKCHVDASISQVILAFIDQYGRLNASHLNAEFFIEKVAANQHFTTSKNPFTKDVLGNDFNESIKDLIKSEGSSDHLELKPDLQSMRIVGNKTAFLLADVQNTDVCPRKMLKQAIKSNGKTNDPSLQMSLSFQVEKVKPDDSEPESKRSDGGFLDDKNEALAFEMQKKMREVGIPVASYSSEGADVRMDLVTKPKQDIKDYLTYADAFAVGKYICKNEAIQNGYNLFLEPSESQDEGLILTGSLLNSNNLFSQKPFMHIRSLNSFKALLDSIDKEDGEKPQKYLNTDANLHLSFSNLIQTVENSSDCQTLQLENPKDFKQSIRQLDAFLEPKEDENSVNKYYKAILRHEIDKFYDKSLTSRFY